MVDKHTNRLVAAADVGGTKTRWGVFEQKACGVKRLYDRTYESKAFPDLESLTTQFLSELAEPVKKLALAVAGPVHHGASRLTNLPWSISRTALQCRLPVEQVLLVNDLEAGMHYVTEFGENADVEVLQPGEKPADAKAVAMVAPGTGLGEAYALRESSANGWRIQASEGGHAVFAPHDALTLDLSRHLMKTLQRPTTVEDVCSGPGIANIYHFLRQRKGAPPEPAWLTQKISAAGDTAPEVVNTALKDPSACDTCRLTLDTFLAILAHECANLALKILADGGLYLGGGIPPRIREALFDGRFIHHFVRPGPMQEVLARIPVLVVREPDAPLYGAARLAFAIP